MPDRKLTDSSIQGALQFVLTLPVTSQVLLLEALWLDRSFRDPLLVLGQHTRPTSVVRTCACGGHDTYLMWRPGLF
jgi:hypothetical protein